LAAVPADGEASRYEEESTDCWFDEPEPGDRRSWAVPRAHGTCEGLDLELLDPGDEDERAMLIEALHPEFTDALHGEGDVIVDGQTINPRLHVAMHQVVANQLLAGDPPETWQTVQRLAGLGYDWHNIMHMIASLVTEDVYSALIHREGDFGLLIPAAVVGSADEDASRPPVCPAFPLRSSVVPLPAGWSGRGGEGWAGRGRPQQLPAA
jgi:Domain of unknown function (DUF1841)